jgi:hypothetical protein
LGNTNINLTVCSQAFVIHQGTEIHGEALCKVVSSELCTALLLQRESGALIYKKLRREVGNLGF